MNLWHPCSYILHTWRLHGFIPNHLQSPLWDIPWNLYPTRKVGQRHLLVPEPPRRFETFNVASPRESDYRSRVVFQVDVDELVGVMKPWNSWWFWGRTAGFGARNLLKNNYLVPIGSMYGIFTYIWLICMVNVGKYTIHGSYGFGKLGCCFWGWLFYSGW